MRVACRLPSGDTRRIEVVVVTSKSPSLFQATPSDFGLIREARNGGGRPIACCELQGNGIRLLPLNRDHRLSVGRNAQRPIAVSVVGERLEPAGGIRNEADLLVYSNQRNDSSQGGPAHLESRPSP